MLPGILETYEEALNIWRTQNILTRKWEEAEYKVCEDFSTINSKEDFFASLYLTSNSYDIAEAEAAVIGAAWNLKVISGEWNPFEVDMPARMFRKLIETFPISLTLIEHLFHLTTTVNPFGFSLAKRTHWLPTELLEKLAEDDSTTTGEALAHRNDIT